MDTPRSVSAIEIPARNGRFIAKEKFVIDLASDAPVRISHISEDFNVRFLSGEGKIEEFTDGSVVLCSELVKHSDDATIIAEFGGEERLETILAEMFSLMEKQRHGEDGVLLNNGQGNIFYTRDQFGVFRTVRIYWEDDGWYICTNSINCPVEWRLGYRVFFRSSK